MQELFKAAIERGASDIHIKTGDFIDLKMNMFNDLAGGEKAGDGNMQDEITQSFGG